MREHDGYIYLAGGFTSFDDGCATVVGEVKYASIGILVGVGTWSSITTVYSPTARCREVTIE